MALILADRVKVRSRSTGLGDFTLENVVEGFQSFAAIGDGNETYYGITDLVGNWEIGRGTYTASGPSLSRDTVISSSNAGAKVNFAAGSKNVFCTFPSSALLASAIPSSIENAPYSITLNSDGSVSYPGDVTQSYQDFTACLAGADTVIYTSTGQYQHAIKLFVMVEGLTDGGGVNWDTQACDIIAVKGYNDNIIHVTAYGVTYSGSAAIATFDGQWNATTSRIEITCSPVSATNSVVASVQAFEMTSND